MWVFLNPVWLVFSYKNVRIQTHTGKNPCEDTGKRQPCVEQGMRSQKKLTRSQTHGLQNLCCLGPSVCGSRRKPTQTLIAFSHGDVPKSGVLFSRLWYSSNSEVQTFLFSITSNAVNPIQSFQRNVRFSLHYVLCFYKAIQHLFCSLKPYVLIFGLIWSKQKACILITLILI